MTSTERSGKIVPRNLPEYDWNRPIPGSCLREDNETRNSGYSFNWNLSFNIVDPMFDAVIRQCLYAEALNRRKLMELGCSFNCGNATSPVSFSWTFKRFCTITRIATVNWKHRLNVKWICNDEIVGNLRVREKVYSSRHLSLKGRIPANCAEICIRCHSLCVVQVSCFTWPLADHKVERDNPNSKNTVGTRMGTVYETCNDYLYKIYLKNNNSTRWQYPVKWLNVASINQRRSIDLEFDFNVFEISQEGDCFRWQIQWNFTHVYEILDEIDLGCLRWQTCTQVAITIILALHYQFCRAGSCKVRLVVYIGEQRSVPANYAWQWFDEEATRTRYFPSDRKYSLMGFSVRLSFFFSFFYWQDYFISFHLIFVNLPKVRFRVQSIPDLNSVVHWLIDLFVEQISAEYYLASIQR